LKYSGILTQTEMTSLPQLPEFGSVRHAYCRPVNVFLYPVKRMGGGEQLKMPWVHGFLSVVRPSTALHESSYTVPVCQSV
jgi:hypothetical protein